VKEYESQEANRAKQNKRALLIKWKKEICPNLTATLESKRFPSSPKVECTRARS
jgi:hypothetical protein